MMQRPVLLVSVLAEATQPVVLMSVFKPIVMMLVLLGWAWQVVQIDRDLDRYDLLPRRVCNTVQLLTALLGFGLWMAIPWFWLGLPLAAATALGPLWGYSWYRNPRVPHQARWVMPWESWGPPAVTPGNGPWGDRSKLQILSPDGDPVPPPKAPESAAEAHRALEDLFDYALPHGAQRVELVTDEKLARVVVWIDGVAYPQPGLVPGLALSMIDYLKDHAGLDIADRRRRLSGSLQVQMPDTGHVDLVVRTHGSTRALKMILEIDPQQRARHSFEQLGLLKSQLQRIEPVLDENHRVFIVTSPPRHGQTTALYSLLKRHDPYTQSIMTLEHQLVKEIEGVNHHQVDPNADAEEIQARIETMLRQAPQVLMLENLDHDQTAKVLVDAAPEVRVYAGMRHNDTFAALRRWIEMIGVTQAAAQSLGGIIGCCLVRKLCTTCRVPYTPDPAVLHKLNLSPDRVGQLYKHSGKVLVKDSTGPCPDCLGLGYRGRVGVFEVLILDEHTRRLLASRQINQLRSYLRKQKMLWLQEVALTKVVEGITSISEVTRVLSQEMGRQ